MARPVCISMPLVPRRSGRALAMNISRFALTVLLLAPAFGCSPDHPVRTASERQLLRVWSAPGSSVEERAEAVNRCFPRGIPVSSIIALLGTNHTEFRLVAISNTGKSFEGLCLSI